MSTVKERNFVYNQDTYAVCKLLQEGIESTVAPIDGLDIARSVCHLEGVGKVRPSIRPFDSPKNLDVNNLTGFLLLLSQSGLSVCMQVERRASVWYRYAMGYNAVVPSWQWGLVACKRVALSHSLRRLYLYVILAR